MTSICQHSQSGVRTKEEEKHSTHFRLSQSAWEQSKLINGDPVGMKNVTGMTSQPWAKFERELSDFEGFPEGSKEAARNPIGHDRSEERFLS